MKDKKSIKDFFKNYVSDRVFKGKRPIPPERAEALRKHYLEHYNEDGTKKIKSRGVTEAR